MFQISMVMVNTNTSTAYSGWALYTIRTLKAKLAVGCTNTVYKTLPDS